MSKAFANPKLFAAATLLFAVATFANFSTSASQPANPLMSRPTPMGGEELKASPAAPAAVAMEAVAR